MVLSVCRVKWCMGEGGGGGGGGVALLKWDINILTGHNPLYAIEH